MAVLSHYISNPLPNSNSRAMVTIAYALLAFILIIWVFALAIVVKEYKEEKDEWNQYWDEVFEKNKYL